MNNNKTMVYTTTHNTLKLYNLINDYNPYILGRIGKYGFIFSHFKMMYNSKKVERFIKDGKDFFWVSYGKMIKDIPYLGTKRKDYLGQIMKPLIAMKLIEIHYDRYNRTFFHLTKLARDIFNIRQKNITSSSKETKKLEAINSLSEASNNNNTISKNSQDKKINYSEVISNVVNKLANKMNPNKQKKESLIIKTEIEQRLKDSIENKAKLKDSVVESEPPIEVKAEPKTNNVKYRELPTLKLPEKTETDLKVKQAMEKTKKMSASQIKDFYEHLANLTKYNN